MRRVGILTFYYNVRNYGAMLQAFALCKTITGLGYECRQISYDRFISSKTTSQQIKEYIRNKKFIKLIKKGMAVAKRKNRCRITKDLVIRNEMFDEFMRLIPHTVPYTEQTIGESLAQFDIFVCGSDQIWNPDWSNDVFFLKFAGPAVKIAYAASIGHSSLTEGYKMKLVEVISGFDSVSLREHQFVEELSTLAGKNIKCVLDPTMLLRKEDYEKICSENIIDGEYALVYLLGSNKANIRTARKIGKYLGLKIAYIPYVGNFSLNDKKNSDFLLCDVGPREFLSLIKNARVVITDSFHACVFSIIFHKNFYCLERKESWHKLTMGNRISSLLGDVSLKGRLLKSFDDINNIPPINYDSVDLKLNELRKNSMNFLRQSLDNVRKENEKRQG
ncbi:polysaccharide pyruvyl transferase family protein [Acetatifactor muris]|jgi:hypothetical protein|uniref:Polysaccharide pyruvyl transferase n=1 Tax=Acetatifactor muris TaxID=879566 RepID=A0A2K4ZD21_9FIRM|nr:polysaccharide pyruvyl transferase family protein [Acetatifactor muris]MCR2046768.1 polysaccharide pyruvyl transferase family protein [Acetatifactor muris]SOY28362.1 Polysaccharide pyruvyl transferase [Acetatifactor muris]